MIRKPAYQNICLYPCLLFAHILSGLHYFFARIDLLEIPACIGEAPGGLYKNLRKIWFARLLKKIVSVWVRSPFRGQALRLVNFSLPHPSRNGLILVTCHTPWKRLLVRWFFENHYALIVDTGRSARRKSRIQTQRRGHNELLHIIRHLRFGGQVIIAADVFNTLNDQPAEILGKPGNLSLLPARLARIAGVPLMAVVPVIRNGRIEIQPGPVIDHPIPCSDMRAVMQKMLGFFEQEIKNDPSIWSYFVNDPLSGFHKRIIK
jgi:hypothetical protein